MSGVADPMDFVYIDSLPDRRLRHSGRRVRIADRDWQPVGDPAAPGGTEGRLRAEVIVNSTPLQIELQSEEVTTLQGKDASHLALCPSLRVRGRQYRLVAVRAV